MQRSFVLRFLVTLTVTITVVFPVAATSPADDDVVPTPLQTQMIFDPLRPTDLDRIDLLLAHLVGNCGWFEPEVVDVRRIGHDIRVDIESAGGFEGGLEPAQTVAPDVPEKCTPAIRYLFAQKVSLGSLDPGTYRVSLYLTQTDGYPDPITVLAGRRTLQVTDAGNEVFLQGGRFRVDVTWTDFKGNSGEGEPVPGTTDESTLFSFFSDDNWELMVKVLDGCALNAHYWIFGAAATNVEYTLTITDVTTGSAWVLPNRLGDAATAFARTNFFPCD